MVQQEPFFDFRCAVRQRPCALAFANGVPRPQCLAIDGIHACDGNRDAPVIRADMRPIPPRLLGPLRRKPRRGHTCDCAHGFGAAKRSVIPMSGTSQPVAA